MFGRIFNNINKNKYQSLQRYLRKLSNAPGTAHEKTTEEKAAEVSEKSWPTLRKYAVIILPTIFGIVLTTTIINNPPLRYITEDYFPSYVAFVRKYHGFSEEDYTEVKRVKELLIKQKCDVNATIYLQDGRKLVMTISGSKLLNDLMSEIVSNYQSDIIDITFQDDTSLPLSLPLSETAISTTATAPSVMPNSSETETTISTLFTRYFPIDLSSSPPSAAVTGFDQPVASPLLWQHSHWDQRFTIPSDNTSSTTTDSTTGGGSSASASSAGDVLNSKQKGMNTLNNNSNNSSSNSNSSSSSKVVTPPLFTPSFQDIKWLLINKLTSASSESLHMIGMEQFDNILQFKLMALRKYLNIKGYNVCRIPQPVLRRVDPSGSSQSQSSSASGSRGATQRAANIAYAKQEILMLQSRLASLQSERRSGRSGSSREIDSIDQDIQSTQQQITSLQRTYINWFYYF